MSVIVKDTGFNTEDWADGFISVEDLAANDGAANLALDVPSDFDPKDIEARLAEIDLIRVNFPSSADGRGFTIAKRLRLMGFAGRLRAKGHVISDQYAMARRSGFDEVEISDELATRQPAEEWAFRANWQDHDYQSRVRA
ncbi:DUF934 domain-containing protein [Halocynthiibacter sp. C4]|uniref:DUF934 domain-containing protein n=1 Tax=Halocynthiibacter sp. C4 TaxID=2992758 RepID=UPI00237B99D9|nr:DUF934 domain-containing protein [Halocynthiibacter sp. C4]MDE0589320.1 DUF934 domain-containing protein [Halocynthiibacter sp. C4]